MYLAPLQYDYDYFVNLSDQHNNSIATRENSYDLPRIVSIMLSLADFPFGGSKALS